MISSKKFNHKIYTVKTEEAVKKLNQSIIDGFLKSITDDAINICISFLVEYVNFINLSIHPFIHPFMNQLEIIYYLCYEILS